MRLKQCILVTICVSSFIILSAQPNISFTNTGWNYSGNTSYNPVTDELTITGDTNIYSKAEITITIPTTESEIYLSADVFLENIVQKKSGAKSWEFPKMKLIDGSTTVTACNYQSPAQGAWHSTYCGVNNYGPGKTTITLQFGFQNASGTYVIKNPKVHYSEPSPTPFTFPYAVPTDTRCQLSINTNNKKTFNNDLLSTNSHFTFTPTTGEKSWSDVEVYGTLNNYYPMENLRFPGGTVGNFYDWSTDGFYPGNATFDSPYRENLYNQSYRFDYTGYKNFVNADAKRSATLMFNMIHDDISSSTSRFSSRISDGLTVKYIELGNEGYYDKQSWGYMTSSDRTSDVTTYINHTSALTTALKSIDPSVKIAVPIDHFNYDAGGWSDKLSKESYYDIAVVHSYVNVDQGAVFDLTTGTTLLNTYKKQRETIEQFKTHFPTTPLIMTEWGVLGSSSFMSAIAVADAFLAILDGNIQDEIVQQAGIHMFYHSDSNEPRTLIYIDGGTVKHTAIGVVYSKLFKVFKGKEVFKALSTSEDISTNLPGVIARAVEDGDSIRVFAVNKLPVSSELVIVEDAIQKTGQFVLESYSMSPETWPDGVADPNIPWTTALPSGSVNLPAYSVNVVSFKKEMPTANNYLTGNTVHIFPNPSDEVVFINGVSDGAPYLFKDMTGQVVLMGNYSAAGIILKGLPSGIYLIEVEGENYKVAVQHQ